ncbi:MAG: hypothetical protein P4M02_10320, partial [Clostridia bacterium]|nr:hypothetical protein [Clostridia bacterium]
SFQGQAPDRLPNSSADKTALLWAETMKENNGAFRFALLAPDLRPREAEKYRRGGWGIGGAGGHIMRYNISPQGATKKDTRSYLIQYQLKGASGPTARETIHMEHYGVRWLVTGYEG